jgi:hypothetical protein
LRFGDRRDYEFTLWHALSDVVSTGDYFFETGISLTHAAL